MRFGRTYTGGGFPVASHSTIMGSTGSTMWSRTLSLMIIGGCLTVGIYKKYNVFKILKGQCSK